MPPRNDELQALRSTIRPGEGEAEPDSRSAALRRMVAELVLETTNEGIWLIDAQARTTFVNRAAAELLGYTEEEMIGLHVFEFMDEQRRPIAQENLMRRQRGVEDRQELQLRRKDGTFVWVIGSAVPVYDREGRYAGSLALLGDLTRQKQTEERLRAEVESLRAKQQPATAAAPPAERPSLLREALRTITLFAAGGTFVSTVGLLTVAGIIGALLGADGVPLPQEY
jgi:PAS domain S-box-containing protein